MKDDLLQEARRQLITANRKAAEIEAFLAAMKEADEIDRREIRAMKRRAKFRVVK